MRAQTTRSMRLVALVAALCLCAIPVIGMAAHSCGRMHPPTTTTVGSPDQPCSACVLLTVERPPIPIISVNAPPPRLHVGGPVVSLSLHPRTLAFPVSLRGPPSTS